MADGGMSAALVPVLERLPKDVIDPDARDRLIGFTRRIDSVLQFEDGRLVVERKDLEALVQDGDFFSPSASKALEAALSRTDEERFVDERGLARPLTERELGNLPDSPSIADVDRFLADLDADLSRVAGLKVVPILDALPDEEPTDGVEPIPPEEMGEKIDAFVDCLKENLRYLVFLVVAATVGVILAVVGWYVPPLEPIALWIVVTYGSAIGAYVIACLAAAGLVTE